MSLHLYKHNAHAFCCFVNDALIHPSDGHAAHHLMWKFHKNVVMRSDEIPLYTMQCNSVTATDGSCAARLAKYYVIHRNTGALRREPSASSSLKTQAMLRRTRKIIFHLSCCGCISINNLRLDQIRFPYHPGFCYLLTCLHEVVQYHLILCYRK